MPWKKLGILLKPQKKISWMAHYAGPSFARIKDETICLYVTGRDQNNISRIGVVNLSIEKETANILHIEKNPIFDIGQPGHFDEDGVSYPWLVEHEGKIFMYYVGWVALNNRTRFQNFTGLAVSPSHTHDFKRIKNVPILDRTNEEPHGSGSCCVFIEDGIWKMYYTAFDPWIPGPHQRIPRYNLKYAESTDGISWKRNQRVIIDYSSSREHIVGKPMLLKEEGLYKLWYSHRGDSYRIGYAESKDGLTYHRKDELVGINASPNGWDSEMIEYAFVFNFKGRKYMIYNGNDFGKTGLGWAVHEAT